MRSRRLLVLLLLSVAAVVAQEKPAPEGASPATVPTSPDASAASTTPEPPKQPVIELNPDANGNVPQEQIRELLRIVAEKDIENEKRLRDYTYTYRQEQKNLDGHGEVKKTEVKTYEVLQIYGEQVERLIAKDDKPLSEKDAQKEDEKIQKVIDKRKNESESDRKKRLEKEEKNREEDRKFVKEVADAFTFRLAPSEEIGGRETWVLDADPRPEYQPKQKEAKILQKFKGRIWIDKQDEQWVKLDMTAIDDMNFGLFLAHIRKGLRVNVEQTRVNEEVWLPKHVQAHVDARLALFKNYNVDLDQSFRDYKKFRTDTKITVVGEK
jgi:hypothetical protein